MIILMEPELFVHAFNEYWCTFSGWRILIVMLKTNLVYYVLNQTALLKSLVLLVSKIKILQKYFTLREAWSKFYEAIFPLKKESVSFNSN